MLQNSGTNAGKDESQQKGTITTDPFNLGKIADNLINAPLESINSNLNFFNIQMGQGASASQLIVTRFNELETQAGNLATIFGGSRDLVVAIKQSIADAVPSVVELGGSLDDVTKIQTGIIKGLQTQTILNKDAYAELFAVTKLTSDGTKDSGAAAQDMVRKFMDAGYGLNNVSKEMTEIINKAREVGVTSVAVYEQLGKSIDKLALYNFSNGVQGMADMAAKAAGLRIDMGATLKLADTLFDPEKAMDMSASFQRLGVQVTSLLDPYKLMDMARNDPAKLQESIIEATKSLTYFDEKNQKMTILPGAQQTLRDLAKEMGMLPEELAKMALNAGDFDRKMKEIRFPTDYMDEKDRTMIANMAQLGEKGTQFEGKYVINFGEDSEGHPIYKAIDELTKEDRGQLEEMNKPAKSAVELQKDANGYLRSMDNHLKALQGIVPLQAAANSKLNESLVKTAKIATKGIEAGQTVIGVGRTASGSLDISGTKKSIESAGKFLKDEIEDVISGKKTMSEVIGDFGTKIKEVGSGAKDKLINLPNELRKQFENDPSFKIDSKKYDEITKAWENAINKVGISTTTKTTQPSNITPTNTVPITPPVVTQPPTSTTPVVKPASLPMGYFSLNNQPNTNDNTITNANPTNINNTNINDLASNIVNDNKTVIDLQKAAVLSLKNIDKTITATSILPLGTNIKNLTDLANNLIKENKVTNPVNLNNVTTPNPTNVNDNLAVNTNDLNNSVNKLIQANIDKSEKPITGLLPNDNLTPNFPIEIGDYLKNINQSVVDSKKNITPQNTITPSLITDYSNVTPKEKPFDVGTLTASLLGIKPQEVKPTPIVPYRPAETTLTNKEIAKNEVTNNVPVSVNPTININGQNLTKDEIQSLIVGHFESTTKELENKLLAKGYNGSSRGQNV